jgi:hypothetical protein
VEYLVYYQQNKEISMGLAFWGGFASGMSQSIEKNRDRVQKQKKLDDANLQRIEDADKTDKESLFNLKMKSEKGIVDLQDKKRKLMSEDYDGTEETRIDAVNDVNGQIFDIYKSTNERAAELGNDPIIDISNYDTTELATVNIDGEEYVVPRDLSATVAESDGNMKFVGNEVHQAVYETNSAGQPIQKKDENGNVVFEPSGQSLRKYNDVFKESKVAKRTTGEVEVGQYDEYVSAEEKAGRSPKTFTGWKAGQKASVSSNPKMGAHQYANKLKSGEVEFDADTAYQHEIDVQGTKTLKPEFTKKVEDFKDSVDLETGYDELSAEWTKSINNGLYTSGLIDTLRQGVAEYAGMDDADIVGLTGEQVATRLGIDTNIGDSVARYVKLISGAAATDKERENLTNVIFGSDYKSEDVRLAKFKAFITKRKGSNERTAKQIIGLAPHTGGSYLYGKKVGEKISNKNDIPIQPTRQSVTKSILASRPNATKAQIEQYLKSRGL